MASSQTVDRRLYGKESINSLERRELRASSHGVVHCAYSRSCTSNVNSSYIASLPVSVSQVVSFVLLCRPLLQHDSLLLHYTMARIGRSTPESKQSEDNITNNNHNNDIMQASVSSLASSRSESLTASAGDSINDFDIVRHYAQLLSGDEVGTLFSCWLGAVPETLG